jgi:predicted transcriptional regulator
MPVSFSVVLSDDRAREVQQLARKNGLREEEVLRQLVDIGLADLDENVRA